MRTGSLIGIALAASSLVWAQVEQPPPAIDIVVTERSSGQDMACMIDGKPCSKKVVQQLSTEAAKRGVMVALAGPDGSLKCTTRARKECLEQAVAIVQTAARIVSARGIRAD